MHRFDIYCE
jgi:hypothetical protein